MNLHFSSILNTFKIWHQQKMYMSEHRNKIKFKTYKERYISVR